MLTHAPITGLTLIIGFFTTVITLDHYVKKLSTSTFSHTALVDEGTATAQEAQLLRSFFRLSLESIPIGPHGTSVIDVLLTSSIIIQMRVLERRWGSGSYLAFVISAAVFGVVLMHLLVTESTSPALSVSSLRVVSCGASLVPLVALIARYLAEIPNTAGLSSRIPGTGIILTSKAFFIVPMMILIMAPNEQLQAPKFRRRAVEVNIGMWTRVLLALSGFLFGVFSTKSLVLSWWLKLFARIVCRPMIRVMQPIFDVLFGGAIAVEHAKPRQRQQHEQTAPNNHDNFIDSRSPFRNFAPFQQLSEQDAGRAVRGDGGRYVVDSLAGSANPGVSDWLFNTAQTPNAAWPIRENRPGNARMRATPLNAAPQAHRSSTDNSNINAAVSESSSNAVTSAAIAQIEELQLGVSKSDIIGALVATDGNVNSAVHLLMN